MCGILGVVGDVPRPRVEHALAMLRHRGPDDGGIHHQRLANGDELAFGHRRLSILDLSNQGHQPMVSAATSAVLTYNGEIYNFQEIRTELVSHGHTFRSNSDTEVLLAAYDQWGEACVERLNGMFAFAIYDASTQRVVLARDRLGIKPLYYFFDGKRFAFASELMALVALKLAPSEIVRDTIVSYLSFGYVPGTATPLRHYAKLEPGGLLTYDVRTRTVSTRRYWSALDVYRQPVRDARDAVDELEALLLDSVKRQLISDVPLGAFLSGGIDSSLVVALMCKVASRVKTFTIGVTDRATDEAPAARRIAQHLGTDHHEEYVSSNNLRQELLEIASLYDEPFADTSAIPTVVVSRLIRKHVTVALSGDGGDELFHGYVRYEQGAQFARFRRLPAIAQRLLIGMLDRAPSPRARRFAFLLRASTPGEFYVRHVSSRAVFPFARDVSFERLWPDEVADEVSRSLRGRPDAEISPAIDLLTYLPGDNLVKVDRASMASSLEVRVPLLDHRVVEFAIRAPLAAKMNGSSSKFVLREILARYLPRALWERPKQGFAIPIGQWFRRELRDWLHDELFSGDWNWTAGVIRRDGVERLVARHMQGPLDFSPSLWALLCLKTWTRRIAAI